MGITGLSDKTVTRWIKAFHARKLVRIEHYQRTPKGGGGNYIAYFEWNPDRLPDARRLQNYSSAERSRRYRAKKKAIAMANIFSVKDTNE